MSIWIWIAFLALIGCLVALDLGVFHRRAHAVSLREAGAWTVFWIVLALAFNVGVYYLYEMDSTAWIGEAARSLTGAQAALQFLTAYLLEKSLSLDNIFVIAMIFAYFRVPLERQHRLLFWGVLGAVVLRGVMIALGVALIERFEWIVYVFGLLLLGTAARMMIVRHDTLEPERNVVVRLTRRFYPVSSGFEDGRLLTRIDGKRAVTPMFLALVMIETSDVMFAVDSIPAVFAVTRDPFIVLTSNVFAILGLRSLYFALAAVVARFRHVKTSLVFILAYVGVKMILSPHYHIPTPVSLAVIIGMLAVGLLASVAVADRDPARLRSPLATHLEELGALTYRQARRVVVIVTGATLLAVGVAMIVLPGPALLVIPAALALLGLEFAWARRWLARLRNAGRSARDHLGRPRR